MDSILGKKAKDKVTGFEGIITSKHEYLTGCTQYALQPNADGNKLPQREYFDEGRLEIIGEGINQADVTGQIDGCDDREHP